MIETIIFAFSTNSRDRISWGCYKKLKFVEVEISSIAHCKFMNYQTNGHFVTFSQKTNTLTLDHCKSVQTFSVSLDDK